MNRKLLGEFEETLMLLIASQGNESHAVAVQESLMENAKRTVNISAIHSTLYRLEKKGYLTSYLGEASQRRGGKSKRIFKVTASGFNELKTSKDFRSKMWETIPQLSFSGL